MSTITAEIIDWTIRRDHWVGRVLELATLVTEWSRLEGWTVETETKCLAEKNVGEYEVPRLRVTLPNGRLSFEPIGLRTLGGEGRIDLEGWPTLSRVKVMGNDWRIMTDSNVPLRVPWSRESFVQLANDLVG